ncbi:MAG: DNA-processing protein DprA, partial [Cyanobacteria bacterium]|nr:DNA-processing protein DprA [Cyanobacteriota bacterium]
MTFETIQPTLFSLEEVRQEPNPLLESSSLENAALIGLFQVSDLGLQKQKILLKAFQGSAFHLWHAKTKDLMGAFPKIFKPSVLTSWEQCHQSICLEETLEKYEAANIHLINQQHPAYPQQLKEIYDAPLLLFVQGNLEAFNGKLIAFVGTRRVGDYGQRVTEKIIQELAQSQVPGITIVSGLAQGVDGISHQAALKYKLPTLAVFGAGIDVIYPKSHKSLAQKIVAEGGALISEYPLGTQPTVYTFPQRNRIVAGLSQGVVVVEGNIKSGSLITARCALEENRSVFAVPGNLFNPGSEGPHYLIQQGAVLCLGA